MTRIIVLSLCVSLFLCSTTYAQYAWRYNSAGNPVYTYKPPAPVTVYERKSTSASVPTTTADDTYDSKESDEEAAARIEANKPFNPADYHFTEALTPVRDMGRYGYADTKGKIVIPCIYTYCGRFIDGLARVKDHSYWGIIDTKGKKIIPPEYEEIYDFHEGLALVKLNKRYGYFNRDGIKVVPLDYYL
ncbi:MAG: WG repeat-containing protein, partial [Chitinophagaceae bacterium]